MDHDDDVQIQDEHDTNIFLPFFATSSKAMQCKKIKFNQISVDSSSLFFLSLPFVFAHEAKSKPGGVH